MSAARAGVAASVKKRRQDWIEAGIRLLREHGQQALTIERLSAELEVTKGSFYHHFGALSGFVQALLDWWEQELTLIPMQQAQAEAEPSQRGKRLAALVSQLDHALDMAVRAWGLRDEKVGAYVRRVDQQRTDCLADLHRAAGHTAPELRGYLEYAAFLGMQQLTPAPQGAERALRRLLAVAQLP